LAAVTEVVNGAVPKTVGGTVAVDAIVFASLPVAALATADPVVAAALDFVFTFAPVAFTRALELFFGFERDGPADFLCAKSLDL
jgi:hypothetical protein